MRKIIYTCLIAVTVISGYFLFQTKNPITGAPPYGDTEEEAKSANDPNDLSAWKRPVGPAKVALQVGHWKNDELPEELEKLKTSTGSSWGNTAEWQVNLEIAQRTKILLESKGVIVDILPATVPEKYWADVFVSIHADGNSDTRVSGFKVASPWRDYSREASVLKDFVIKSYKQATRMDIDPNVSKNMRGYYAFAWWKYKHSIHPMTTAIILESGFLTNWSDRQIIVSNPQKSAEGLALGIIDYLLYKKLL